MQDILEQAKQIRLVIFDVDGIRLTFEKSYAEAVFTCSPHADVSCP